MIKIVIPTYNRINGEVKALEYGWLPKSYYKNVYLCVRTSELEKYSHYKAHGINITELKDLDGKGISETRDLICRLFANNKIWMIDDDIKLLDGYIRPDKSYICPKDITEESFYELIEHASSLLDSNPYGVCAVKIFPKPISIFPHTFNKWAFFNSFINLKTLNADQLNYCSVKYYEDVVSYLSAFYLGYDNFYLTRWQVQCGKPQLGGNADARKENIMRENSIIVNSMFPDSAKLINMHDKTNDRLVFLRIQPKRPK